MQAWAAELYRHLKHSYEDPGPFELKYVTTGPPGNRFQEVVAATFTDFEAAVSYAYGKYGRYCSPQIVGNEEPDYGQHPATLIYPVPNYKLKTFVNDPWFSQEYREAAAREVEAWNAEVRARYKRLCTPDNHKAYRLVSSFYAEHTPALEWIEHPETIPESTLDWWGRYSEHPTPETCPGDSVGEHTVNTNWCQACGWKRHPGAIQPF